MIEDDIFSFRKKLINATFAVTIALTVLLTTGMVLYASSKTVVVTEEDSLDLSEKETDHALARWTVEVKKENSGESRIEITLPVADGESGTEVISHLEDSTCEIVVKNTKSSYFLSNTPKGGFKYVTKEEASFDGTDTRISFSLERPCVAEGSFESGRLIVTLTPVSEIEKEIVVLDPYYGGSSNGIRVGDVCEKNINLAIAEKTKEFSKDKPYLVLLTREEDTGMTARKRTLFTNNAKASYYIGITLDSDAEDLKSFGISGSYNPDCYHNGLENADFAGIVVNSVAESTVNKVNLLNEAEEDETVLKVLDMPSMLLYAGFLSNADECKLLQSDEYVEKIALGILNALDKVTE